MKRLIFVAACVALLGVAAVYTVSNAGSAPPSGTIDLSLPGQIVFRDKSGYVASVPLKDPGGHRTVSGLACARFHATTTLGVCLAAGNNRFAAILVDPSLAETRRLNPPGIPSRARTNGHQIAWTSFVTGHSYAGTGFSTVTSILDLDTDKYYADIETLRMPLRGRDINLWGVTFTPGGFYATAAAGGRTYLISGSLATWEAQTVRENVECPSFGFGRIAFKKRLSTGAWRLAVLDPATMAETELPGTDGLDDQAIWLDDHTLIYGMGTDIWSVPADGSAPPHLLIADASSPSVL